MSLTSAQTYNPFFNRKTPLDVSVALNLRWYGQLNFGVLGAKVATAFGYDDITLFLKLYRLSNATRMIMPYVVKLLEIANNMPEIESDITDCKEV